MHMIYLKRAFVAAAAASGAVFVAGAGMSDSATAGDANLRCTIETLSRGGAVELSALVSAPRDLNGSYRLRISKDGGGGSADIDQSGEFSVVAGERAVVSSVSLGGDGTYTAKLSVTANGRTVDCSKRTGGSIGL
jgi:hypothetical protein